MSNINNDSRLSSPDGFNDNHVVNVRQLNQRTEYILTTVAVSAGGLTGPSGEQGIQGVQGERGDTGPTGQTGPTGEKGDIGQTGPTGNTGERGHTGEQGPTGPKGDIGLPSSVTGPTGDRGETGPYGHTGERGQTGPEGPEASINDIQGMIFQSANSTATTFSANTAKLYNTGTITLSSNSQNFSEPSNGRLNYTGLNPVQIPCVLSYSITITPSSTGITYTMFVRKNGVNIPESRTVLTVANNSFSITSSKTITSSIGSNDYFEVWITSSQSLSGTVSDYSLSVWCPKGSRGEIGSQGQQGIQGPVGDKGDTGATGPASTVAGPQGPQGVKGDTGATGPASTVAGPQGPQGVKGDTGATGPASTVAGPQGPQGPQGVKGDTGATGPASTVAGPQGPQGVKGDTGATGANGPTGSTGFITAPTAPVAGTANQILLYNTTNNTPHTLSTIVQRDSNIGLNNSNPSQFYAVDIGDTTNSGNTRITSTNNGAGLQIRPRPSQTDLSLRSNISLWGTSSTSSVPRRAGDIVSGFLTGHYTGYSDYIGFNAGGSNDTNSSLTTERVRITGSTTESTIDIINSNGDGNTVRLSNRGADKHFFMSNTDLTTQRSFFRYIPDNVNGATGDFIRLVEAGGNVLIGATAMSNLFKLDVAGDTRIRNDLYLGTISASNTSNAGSGLYFSGSQFDITTKHAGIQRRQLLTGTSDTELLIYNFDDPSGSGSDKIRLLGASIGFDTYNTTNTNLDGGVRALTITGQDAFIEGGLAIGSATITSGKKLHIEGDSVITGDLNVGSLTTTIVNSSGINLNNSAGTSIIEFSSNTNDHSSLRLNSNNLRLENSHPTGSLQLCSGSYQRDMLGKLWSSSGSYNQLIIRDDTNGGDTPSLFTSTDDLTITSITTLIQGYYASSGMLNIEFYNFSNVLVYTQNIPVTTSNTATKTDTGLSLPPLKSYSYKLNGTILTYNQIFFDNKATFGISYNSDRYKYTTPRLTIAQSGLVSTSNSLSVGEDIKLNNEEAFRLRRNNLNTNTSFESNFENVSVIHGLAGVTIGSMNRSTGSGETTIARFTSDTSGNRRVLIGSSTTIPSYQFQLSIDSAFKPGGSNTWTTTSDQRLKEDIQPANLDLCYDIVKNLPLRYYKWKDEYINQTEIKDKHRLGWVADECEVVFPKAITIAEGELFGIKDCKGLNTDLIYASMYGAIQKLMAKVETLEAISEKPVIRRFEINTDGSSFKTIDDISIDQVKGFKSLVYDGSRILSGDGSVWLTVGLFSKVVINVSNTDNRLKKYVITLELS